LKTIRIGIIGSGGIAQNAHLPGYKATEGVELVACCDVREETAQAASKKFDIPVVYTDYRKMLREEKLDGVSVCTPNAYHARPTIDALRAGLHVLCEKPMAMTPAEGRAMCAAAKKARRILQIGLNSRFTGYAQVLKKFIKGGELGEVYYARAQALRRRGIPGWGVFTSRKMSGGGPLIDIGVHILDLTLFMMGHPEPVSVSGATYCNFGKRTGIYAPWGAWDPKKYTVEDLGVGFVKFKNGASLTLEASWAAHIDEDVWKVTLMGTEGGAVTSPMKILQEKHGSLVDVTPRNIPETQSHTEEVRAFVRAIREGRPSPVPGEQGLMSTRILDGIYRSAESGKEVKV
jgi:predicted dehydrogenase